jgi:hypothetical protein
MNLKRGSGYNIQLKKQKESQICSFRVNQQSFILVKVFLGGIEVLSPLAKV